MWYRILGVLAVIGFAIMMSVRSELSSVAARAMAAAIAGGFSAMAWICLARSRASSAG